MPPLSMMPAACCCRTRCDGTHACRGGTEEAALLADNEEALGEGADGPEGLGDDLQVGEGASGVPTCLPALQCIALGAGWCRCCCTVHVVPYMLHDCKAGRPLRRTTRCDGCGCSGVGSRAGPC